MIANCHPDKKHKARGLCYACYRKWHQVEYREYYRQKSAESRLTEYRKTYHREYRQKNRRHLALTLRKWRLENPGKNKYYVNKRRAMQVNATPKWADTPAMQLFYENCPGGYHVDHIYPLNSDWVCGLHTLENLQYLPASENAAKGNRRHITQV